MTAVLVDADTLPPLVGKAGIASMLGVPASTVDDWRAKSLADPEDGHIFGLPRPDRHADNRPFWKPVTIVDWAVEHGLLPADHGLPLPPPDLQVWSQADIAKHFGVELATVRERYRHHYTHAKLHELPVPANALCPEDWLIDGTPFWRPESVIAWGRETGKLDKDGNPNQRKGLRWVAVPEPVPVLVDPMDALIACGELWDWDAIASFFDVKIKTVKMWASPWSAGKNFPPPDDTKIDGSPVWVPKTILDWARASRRLGTDGLPLKVGGGRLPQDPAAKAAKRAKAAKAA